MRRWFFNKFFDCSVFLRIQFTWFILFSSCKDIPFIIRKTEIPQEIVEFLDRLCCDKTATLNAIELSIFLFESSIAFRVAANNKIRCIKGFDYFFSNDGHRRLFILISIKNRERRMPLASMNSPICTIGGWTMFFGNTILFKAVFIFNFKVVISVGVVENFFYGGQIFERNK